MKKILLTVLLVFPWSFLGFAFLGCQSRPPTEKPPPAATKPVETMTDRELREYADRLTGELAAARTQIETNRLAHIKKLLDYAALGFGVLALACLAVVIWTPWKKQGLLGALACAGLAPTMLFLVKLAPWFSVIGGAIFLGGLTVAAMVIKGLVRKDKMVTSLVTGAEDYIVNNGGAAAEKLKANLSLAQDKAGITEELRTIRRKLGL
jgi:hypothetical protein